MSKASLDSINCRDELSLMKDYHKPFIMVRIEEVDFVGGMALRFGRYQYFNWYTYDSNITACKDLLKINDLKKAQSKEELLQNLIESLSFNNDYSPIKSDSSNNNELYELANSFLLKEDYDDALRTFKSLQNQNIMDLRAYLGILYCEYHVSNTDGLIAAAIQAEKPLHLVPSYQDLKFLKEKDQEMIKSIADHIDNEILFNKIKQKIANKEYNVALSLLKELERKTKEYDLKEYYAICRYEETYLLAIDLMGEENYDQAISLFYRLNNYKDSSKLINRCEQLKKEKAETLKKIRDQKEQEKKKALEELKKKQEAEQHERIQKEAYYSSLSNDLNIILEEITLENFSVAVDILSKNPDYSDSEIDTKLKNYINETLKQDFKKGLKDLSPILFKTLFNNFNNKDLTNCFYSYFIEQIKLLLKKLTYEEIEYGFIFSKETAYLDQTIFSQEEFHRYQNKVKQSYQKKDYENCIRFYQDLFVKDNLFNFSNSDKESCLEYYLRSLFEEKKYDEFYTVLKEHDSFYQAFFNYFGSHYTIIQIKDFLQSFNNQELSEDIVHKCFNRQKVNNTNWLAINYLSSNKLKEEGLLNEPEKEKYLKVIEHYEKSVNKAYKKYKFHYNLPDIISGIFGFICFFSLLLVVILTIITCVSRESCTDGKYSNPILIAMTVFFIIVTIFSFSDKLDNDQSNKVPLQTKKEFYQKNVFPKDIETLFEYRIYIYYGIANVQLDPKLRIEFQNNQK